MSETSDKGLRQPIHIVENADDVELAVKSFKCKMTLCKSGHITDDYGYCYQKGCKYSRGHVTSKVKR